MGLNLIHKRDFSNPNDYDFNSENTIPLNTVSAQIGYPKGSRGPGAIEWKLGLGSNDEQDTPVNRIAVLRNKDIGGGFDRDDINAKILWPSPAKPKGFESAKKAICVLHCLNI